MYHKQYFSIVNIHLSQKLPLMEVSPDFCNRYSPKYCLIHSRATNWKEMEEDASTISSKWNNYFTGWGFTKLLKQICKIFL